MNKQEIKFEGNKIKEFLPKNTSVAAFAREVGISRQAMHDIIKGRRNPSANVLVKILTILNIPIDKVTNNFQENVS